MDSIQIILIIAGAIIFIISFIMPEMGSELEQVDPELTQKQIKDMIRKEMGSVKDQVSEIVEETSNYSVEKTERALERLTNEKISAVSEYSDTVMEDIHKSHEEVMFLYDMLNNKHEDLKQAVSEVSASVKEARVTEEALQNASMDAKSEISREKEQPEEEEKEKGSEPSFEETFHSETAKEFFARHEADQAPSIEDIRASFQPMAFGSLPSVESDERVFGQTQESEMPELSELDEAEVDAAIDELLGVETAEEEAEDAPVDKASEKKSVSPAEKRRAVSTQALDTEAAMDAALAALTGEMTSENEEAAAESAVTALENEQASSTDSGTALENEQASSTDSETALENEQASSTDSGTALENEQASSTDNGTAGVFGELQESLTAIVKEQEQAGNPYAADEDEVRALVKEKPVKKSAGTRKGAKSGKEKAGKEKAGDIALQFRMDQKGDNNNEKILKLHEKGKSNIAIAKELGLGVGEVKLVLDLFKGM